jgi:hypothetical protein
VAAGVRLFRSGSVPRRKYCAGAAKSNAPAAVWDRFSKKLLERTHESEYFSGHTVLSRLRDKHFEGCISIRKTVVLGRGTGCSTDRGIQRGLLRCCACWIPYQIGNNFSNLFKIERLGLLAKKYFLSHSVGIEPTVLR